jgi:hypothetical protein
LTIAVLLSQTARNVNYLSDSLDQLGFQGVDLRNRRNASDRFTYIIMVNSFIFAGAGLSTLFLIASWLGKPLAHHGFASASLRV